MRGAKRTKVCKKDGNEINVKRFQMIYETKHCNWKMFDKRVFFGTFFAVISRAENQLAL